MRKDKDISKSSINTKKSEAKVQNAMTHWEKMLGPFILPVAIITPNKQLVIKRLLKK